MSRSGLLEHLVIPAHYERLRKQSDEVCTLCISFKSIEGLPSAKIGSGATVHVQVLLFDSVYQQFFGRCWDGPEVSASGKQSVVYDVKAYLYSPIITNSKFLLVAQVILKQNNKSSLIGWGYVRPIKDGAAPLPDTAGGEPIVTQKMELYYGSPRALPLFKEPIELTTASSLKRIAGTQVMLSIAHHDAMEPALGYFPENIIVGQNDFISGILKKESDMLWRPRFQKAVNCLLDNIHVVFSPNLKEFESSLISQLSQDVMNRECLSSEENVAVTIVERRLQVGVHNGWTYVEPPESLALAVVRGRDDNTSTKSHVNGSAKRQSNCLYARNKLHFEELVQDKRCVLVFIVEYTISEPVSQRRLQVSAAEKTRSRKQRRVYLRVGAINPLLEQKSQEITVKLHGAPLARKVKSFMVFNEDLTSNVGETGNESRPRITAEVSFRFSREDAQAPTVDQVSGAPIQQPQGDEIIFRRSALKSTATPVGQPLPSAESEANLDSSQLGTVSAEQLEPFALESMHYPFPSGSGFIQTDSASPSQLKQPDLTQSSQPAPVPVSQMKTVTITTQTVRRGTYSRLYDGNYPRIVDRNGEAPEVIDSSTPLNFDMHREENDVLVTNEVVLQFLAFSRALPDVNGTKSVYFTFQFYRFPQAVTERMRLATQSEISDPFADMDSDSTSGGYSPPFILRRDDQKMAGYTLRFLVDPKHMSVNEKRQFIQYLTSHALHIDVWDGDSLMLIGSCAVELKRLCRQGCEAVQVTYELEVSHTEYVEDLQVQPSNAVSVRIRSIPRGKLHLRMANIGRPAGTQLTQDSLSLATQSKRYVVTYSDKLAADDAAPPYSIASPFIARNRDVAEMITNRKLRRDDESVDDADLSSDGKSQVDSERLRKLRRMQLVRNEQRVPQATTHDTDAQYQSMMAHRESQKDKARDLQTIDEFRRQAKKEVIFEALQNFLSVRHAIWPSFGTGEFFEYEFVNRSDKAATIYVQSHDPELQVVSSAAEWWYLKKLHGLDTPLTEQLFNQQDAAEEHEHFCFVAQPRETLYIPLKYVTMLADHTILSTVPQQGNVESQFSTASRVQDARQVKLLFLSAETRNPVSVLDLNVVPQPHIVDQTFRFYHPEQTFLKKMIRLPSFPVSEQSLTSMDGLQLVARSSDPSVVCETKLTPSGKPHDIMIRVALGAAPQVQRFFVAVYADQYAWRPIQIWQFFVHALQRVDVSCSEGQISRFALVLRGTQTSRLVQAYASHSELDLYPAQSFVLAANSAAEVVAHLKSQIVGHRYMRVHVIDVEYKQLVRAWLVCVACRHPMISKAFELKMPVGGGKESNKTIRYTNPYPTKRTFLLRTNRDELLQFKESQLTIAAGASEAIVMRFAPVVSRGMADIIVFVNDENEKLEEAFCVRVIYE